MNRVLSVVEVLQQVKHEMVVFESTSEEPDHRCHKHIAPKLSPNSSAYISQAQLQQQPHGHSKRPLKIFKVQTVRYIQLTYRLILIYVIP